MGNLTTRRWCADEGTLTLLGAFFVAMLCTGAVGAVVMSAFVPDPPAGADGYVFRGWVPFAGAFMVITLVQGVGSLIGVGLIIRSYQLAESSFISVFENAMIVFATLWAIVLWHEVPSIIGVTGLGLIVASGVIISLRTGHRTARPA
jgi:drug/metabolite transporter (DMT)-like permease